MPPAFVVALCVTGAFMSFCAFGFYGWTVIWYTDSPARVLFASQVVPWAGLALLLVAALVFCVQMVFIVLASSLHRFSWPLFILNLVFPWIAGILFFEFLWLASR